MVDMEDFDRFAGVGIAGQTALQSLAPYVTAGDRVFINGGSGGCGTFAIQLAKILGCQVTTTCSTRNVALCRDLGADEVIDYTATPDLAAVLASHGRIKEGSKNDAPAYSHVVDHIGLPHDLYSQSHRFLLPGKSWVQVGTDRFSTLAGRLLRPGFLGGGRRSFVPFFFRNRRCDLLQLGRWVQEGRLRVVIDSVYDMKDARSALERLRSGRATGKIIVHDPANQYLDWE